MVSRERSVIPSARHDQVKASTIVLARLSTDAVSGSKPGMPIACVEEVVGLAQGKVDARRD